MTNETEAPAVARLAVVRGAVDKAARAAGRDPAAVTLIAVSKTFPAEAIMPVLDSGQRVFGENYVQESAAKWPALRERYAGLDLHLIGPLQSNKAREAVALFDTIQSLDRDSLARELARAIERQGRAPRLFVQVNTGAEPQKGGVLPGETDDFVRRCRQDFGFVLDGLMCIPPADEPPGPHFALLADIAARNGLAGLSMGMSADFETAVAFGATHVRVGSAIFGAR
jgi:hypothetical protein